MRKIISFKFSPRLIKKKYFFFKGGLLFIVCFLLRVSDIVVCRKLSEELGMAVLLISTFVLLALIGMVCVVFFLFGFNGLDY